MELKRLNDYGFPKVKYSLNRTFMELKREELTYFIFCNWSLNRTFMELKQGIGLATDFRAIVLIAPLWN